MGWAEVGHVQLTAGAEHTEGFAGGLHLLLGAEVVKDQATEHAVERAVGIGESGRRSLSQKDLRPGPGGFLPRRSQDARVDVHAEYFALRVHLLNQNRQRRCAAAQIEDAVAGGDTRLADEAELEHVLAHRPADEWIDELAMPAHYGTCLLYTSPSPRD